MKGTKCPLCGSMGHKALVGPFPVRLCVDDACTCVWGFWSDIAPWVYHFFTPSDDMGWCFTIYGGSYIRALFRSIACKLEEP